MNNWAMSSVEETFLLSTNTFLSFHLDISSFHFLQQSYQGSPPRVPGTFLASFSPLTTYLCFLCYHNKVEEFEKDSGMDPKMLKFHWIMNGINAPEVVELLGSDDGKNWQLKKSRNDDLRQDAVSTLVVYAL
ncbi:hypothetical protein VNO77_19968 [Canavalia gladiata]|uniref:Uncharacterized protein n=1 Tax=Canavalia gladiata TaxID=3824 RepID=A0AAN9LRW4_CANGL